MWAEEGGDVMRLLSDNELEQIEQKVLTQLSATGESSGSEKLANAITQISARVCRLMLQEYQKAVSSSEHL